MIQSISDIITNSSSEVFCRIESENNLDIIKRVLKPLFSGEDSEMEPCLTMMDKTLIDDNYALNYYKDYPEKWIEISLPYSMDSREIFFSAGLEAILSDRVPSGYKIIYT